MGEKKRLLFVCVENSNRSQMAEAFARILGGDKVEVYSAGSKPSGIINPKAIKAMAELNYDLASHQSSALDQLPDVTFDVIATMGCGDACPHLPGRKRLDWSIPDPKNMEPENFRQVREVIRGEVQNALDDLLKP